MESTCYVCTSKQLLNWLSDKDSAKETKEGNTEPQTDQQDKETEADEESAEKVIRVLL